METFYQVTYIAVAFEILLEFATGRIVIVKKKKLKRL